MDIVNFLAGLVKEHNPNCLCLFETKCGRKRMEHISGKLGFCNMIVVDSVGRAGGMMIMWNENVNIELCMTTERVIHCYVMDYKGMTIGNLLASHRTPYEAEKKLFWDNLQGVVEGLFGSWLIVGDLNEITSEYEKIGGMVYGEKSFFY